MNVGYTRIKMVAKKIPKRDACYHKVKRAMPKSSAYRSGHIRYRKVGAKYYNIGSKKKMARSYGLRKWFSHNKVKRLDQLQIEWSVWA